MASGAFSLRDGMTLAMPTEPGAGRAAVFLVDLLRETRGIRLKPVHSNEEIAAAPLRFRLLGVPTWPAAQSSLPAPAFVPSDWGIYPNLYNAEEATFRFLQGVLTEVMSLFPSRYIQSSGDEAMKDQQNPAFHHRKGGPVVHDLCLKFSRPSPEPTWALDRVSLLGVADVDRGSAARQ